MKGGKKKRSKSRNGSKKPKKGKGRKRSKKP